MTFSKWLAAGGLVILTATASQAEERGECACVTPVATNAASVGFVTGTQGDVMLSTREGFSPAVPGQQLTANSQIILGCEAAASIQLGNNCQLSLQPGSEVSLVAAEGQICVRSVHNDAMCGGGSLQSSHSTHEPGHGFGLPEALFLGTVAGGAGIAAAFGSGDDPASP